MKRVLDTKNLAEVINSDLCLLEVTRGVVSQELAKWHNSGVQIKNKLPDKKVSSLARKVQDRIAYHSDAYKSSGNRHDAAIHFMQMVKLHHLFNGLKD